MVHKYNLLTVNKDLITLSSLIRLKIIITQNKINDISKCDFFLKLTCSDLGFFSKSIISIQNDVVREVRASLPVYGCYNS